MTEPAAPTPPTVKELGGTGFVARLLGIAPPSVSGWNNRIPAERCPDLERGLDGRWTCEQLRPDVRWMRVPDPAWPHPAGRPCLDVASPAPATAAA